MKRLLSVFLSLTVLIISVYCLSFSVSALSGVTGDCAWSLDGTVLTVSGNGKMGDFAEGDSSDRPWGNNLTEVIIKDGVTEVGAWAFYGNKTLKKLTVPDSVIRLNNGAFSECSALCEVDLGENVEYIGEFTFGYCSSLKAFELPPKMKEVTGFSFLCSGIESMYFHENISVIDQVAFEGCALKKIKFAGKKVDIAGCAFDYCMFLKEIDFGDGEISIYANAFAGCESLEKIDLSSVVYLDGSVFPGCKSLKEVIIGDKLTKIGGFMECESLEEITFGKNVDTIKEMAFYGCKSLKKVTINNNIKFVGYEAFMGCEALAEINVGDYAINFGKDAIKDTAYYNDSSNWENGLLYLGRNLMAASDNFGGSYSIKDGTLSVAGGVFEGFLSIVRLHIPESVVSIGANAFNNCYTLTNVYYGGSKEQWEELQKTFMDNGNASLLYAYVSYNTNEIPPFSGDLDGDANITTGDLAVLKLVLAGMEEDTYEFYDQADFNMDGTVNSSDLAEIKLYLAVT